MPHPKDYLRERRLSAQRHNAPASDGTTQQNNQQHHSMSISQQQIAEMQHGLLEQQQLFSVLQQHPNPTLDQQSSQTTEPNITTSLIATNQMLQSFSQQITNILEGRTQPQQNTGPEEHRDTAGKESITSQSTTTSLTQNSNHINSNIKNQQRELVHEEEQQSADTVKKAQITYILEGHGGLVKSLQPQDVLSGRGPGASLHPGNVNLRSLAKTHKQQYNAAKKRGQKKTIAASKKEIAESLVKTVRNGGGRFLKEVAGQEGRWKEIGDVKATAKLSQLLRDAGKDSQYELSAEYLYFKKNASGTATGKKSNKKGPNKPKKSRSAYNYFYSEQYQIIKAANPNVTNVGEIGKLVAEYWKSLSGEDKAPYEKLAAADALSFHLRKAAEDKDGSTATSRNESSLKKKSSSQKKKKQKTEDDVDMWKRKPIYPKDENEKRELLGGALNGKTIQCALSDKVGLDLYTRMAKVLNPSGNQETWATQGRQTLENEKRLYPVKEQFSWHLLKFPASKPPSS